MIGRLLPDAGSIAQLMASKRLSCFLLALVVGIKPQLQVRCDMSGVILRMSLQRTPFSG